MTSSGDSCKNSFETDEWIISSVNSTILNSQDYERFRFFFFYFFFFFYVLFSYNILIKRWHKELDLKALPEMVFGYNKLVLKNKKNQFSYQFNAYDSLKLVSKDEPPFKVVHSTSWTKSNQDQLRELSNPQVLYDWTFETKYQGTIESNEESYEIIDIDNPEEKGIPYDLLRRNEPILKYFEVHLFEDELADNGISELVVRCVCFFVFTEQIFFLKNLTILF